MRGRRDLAALRRLAASVRNEQVRPRFLDGLVLGAMVGAAIAGSTLWSRWRARHGLTVINDHDRPGGAAPEKDHLAG
jgi:hypothetical protein